MKSTNKNIRQKVLEHFLNDEVEKITPRLFKWRGRYYEVLTYSQTLKKHNWSQFVNIAGDWRMREMSKDMIKKYYPKVLTDN